jgi:hypothetical protein
LNIDDAVVLQELNALLVHGYYLIKATDKVQHYRAKSDEELEIVWSLYQNSDVRFVTTVKDRMQAISRSHPFFLVLTTFA